ncbi:hypothetical protein PHYC_02641 [Phycisphaerales bacterium]|nr:hypothetical protein PHYC_02641 [Phycisphaerales bacterium]
MRTNSRVWLLIAAAGTCLGGVAQAQVSNGGVVNISGATLLENWSASRASTNDFIDVDGDGISGYLGTTIGGIPDQLADGGPSGFGTPGSPTAQELVIQYRVTGSVNGFFELLTFGSPVWVTTDSFDPAGILGADIDGPPIVNPGRATTAYNNRVAYIGQAPNTGMAVGVYNQGNPGGAPNRADMTTFRATYAAPHGASAGGIQIDVSPLDVSTFLAVRKPGVPLWSLPSAAAGYGTNPRNSVNKQGGTSGANLSSQLLNLGTRNLFDPSNPGAADSNTIFDTDLLFAPIAPVVNFGTGIQRLKISEIQHLFVTGRAVTGENFIVVTRDVGSGTRNAFNNCTGVDPSWGNGENIGPRSSGSTQNNLGAGFIPSNKNGNGDVEATMRNTRLGVAYIGTERGVTGSGSGSWLTTGALEIADVQNDVYGGTAYVRPTTSNILHNTADGWVIGGQAVVATLGDPRANAAALGGTGWVGAFDPFVDGSNGFPADGAYQIGEAFTDLNGNGTRDASNAEAGLANTHPMMANPFAAGYLNNISRSIAAFQSVPNDVANIGMPGEYAANQFLALAAMDYLHSNLNYLTMTANSGKNSAVQDYIAGNNVHNNPLFASFNTAIAGKVPTRTTGAVYSDGVGNGQNYIDQGGAVVSYSGTIAARNKMSFDFDGDGQRTLADAPDMLRAWRQRNGGPAWAAPEGIYGPGSGAGTVIEIIGDGDGDGSLNRMDVRIWADGLAMQSGHVDRAAGFAAVDTAFQSVAGTLNFFGTLLANAGETYAAGDSRGDVANASNAAGAAAPVTACISRGQINPTTRGWSPIGADGNGDTNTNNDSVIDCVDITYVYMQFRNASVTDGAADWSDLNEAAYFDLSADMDGDLDVDAEDVRVLVEDILGTQLGDVNCDGARDAADLAIANANLGMANPTYCCGDVDGDGDVDQDDIAVIAGTPPCDPDVNCDGAVNGFDVQATEEAVNGDFSNFCQASADLNGDGTENGFDIETEEQRVNGAPC